jgi:hypothetical protein
LGIKEEQRNGKRERVRNDKARKAMLLLSATFHSTHPIQSKYYLHTSIKEPKDWESKKNNQRNRVRVRTDKARKAMLLLSASFHSTHPIQSKNYLQADRRDESL